MISRELKCIFVHIPKTGGTSVETKLGYFDGFPDRVQDHRPLREIGPWPPVAGRGMLMESGLRICAKRMLRRSDPASHATRGEYGSFLKFSVVRNPWDRVHSWYRNVMRDSAKRERWRVPAECSFHDFLLRHLRQWGLRSQLYWLLDWRGKIGVDLVLRFESLQQDFDRVAARLGLGDALLPYALESGGRSHRYVDAYDEITRAIVERAYAREVRLFRYAFGA